MLISNKRLDLAERLAAGQITVAGYTSELQVFIYQLETQIQMIANQKAIAKNTKCISERQRTAGKDYSGVDSTNGAVAIISLLAAVSDAASVSSACD